MIAQEKITSGFDVEFLIGQEYLRHILLTLFETGTLPWYSVSEEKDRWGNLIKADTTLLHPNPILETSRLYTVHEEFAGNEHPYLYRNPAYSSQEDEFNVEYLFDHPLGATFRVKVYPTIIENSHDPAIQKFYGDNIVPIFLDIKLDILHSAPDDNGLIGNLQLKIELVDVSGPLVTVALALTDENGDPIYTKEDLMEMTSGSINKTMPLNLSGGGKIQKLAWQVFPASAEHDACIAVYLNLALQKGPQRHDYVADRGDISNAQNFLPVGSKMAFGFHKDCYARLAKDFYHKMAELKKGSTTEYHYPLMDGDEQVGRIHGVSMYSENVMGVFTNRLVIDVHGEYILNNLPDPDFHLQVFLKPVNRNGVMEMEIDYDVDISAVAQIVAFILEIGITVVAPKLGISLLVLTLAGVSIAEHILTKEAEKKINESGDLTFLDSMPHKLMIEQRRWDPLYSTIHQVEMRADNIQINQHGFAFSAGELFVGKRFEPLSTKVIRNVARDENNNEITGLYYRTDNYAAFSNNDFINIFPATDRMPYEAVVNPNNPVDPNYRILLTMEQVNNRLNGDNKHLRKIPYEPQKINLVDNQIKTILTISDLERAEIENFTRRVLRNMFLQSHGNVFRTAAENELTFELGRTPSTEEINERVEQMVALAVASEFPARYQQELDLRMTLSLEPSEFAALQYKQLLELGKDKLEIITREDNGTKTVYYRDIRYKPDPEPKPSDNLLDLPRY